MFDTILIPTDGSDHAIRAGEHGAALARAFDATLHVVSMVDLRRDGGPFNAGGLREEVREQFRNDARRAIDLVEEVVDGPDERQTAVLEGDPVDDLLAYADDHDVDLIAMGTQGRTGLDRYVAGSIAEGVIRRADVPILTVRATDWSRGADPYEEILVPTDGSAYATAAVEPALAFAAQFDARVRALHVVDVRAVAPSGGYTPPTEVFETLRSRGETAVEDVASRAREAGLEATTRVLEGRPASELLDYAQDEHVDVIAMGTAGRTGLDRFLVGSTAERVIRHADMPVLAVNARDEGAD